jgi:hypothetical protein
MIQGEDMISDSLLSSNGAPRPALVSLLKLLEVSHDGTLPGIVSATQAPWLRKTAERWELSETLSSQKEKALPLLQQLGCVDTISPQKQQYDIALVLGGYKDRMDARFDYLIKLWKEGVRFNKLIFLTGARPIDFEHEDVCDCLETETELMQFLYEELDLPEEMRHIPVTIVDTPAQKKEDGSLRRPNTADTLREWLKQNPDPCTALFISNQPLVGYQDSVMRTELPQTIPFETVGPQADDDTLLALYLDNLARWLYQEHTRRR